jgi:hypothetical protein
VVVTSPIGGMVSTTVAGGVVTGSPVAGSMATGSPVAGSMDGVAVGTVVLSVAGTAVGVYGRLAAAITVVSPNTADAVSPVARMRAPAATCGCLGFAAGAGAVRAGRCCTCFCSCWTCACRAAMAATSTAATAAG